MCHEVMLFSAESKAQNAITSMAFLTDPEDLRPIDRAIPKKAAEGIPHTHVGFGHLGDRVQDRVQVEPYQRVHFMACTKTKLYLFLDG